LSVSHYLAKNNPDDRPKYASYIYQHLHLIKVFIITPMITELTRERSKVRVDKGLSLLIIKSTYVLFTWFRILDLRTLIIIFVVKEHIEEQAHSCRKIVKTKQSLENELIFALRSYPFKNRIEFSLHDKELFEFFIIKSTVYDKYINT